MIRTLLIDNTDSFTLNLFHLLAEVNECAPTLVPNDWTEFELSVLDEFDNVGISPGTGDPRAVGRLRHLCGGDRAFHDPGTWRMNVSSPSSSVTNLRPCGSTETYLTMTRHGFQSWVRRPVR